MKKALLSIFFVAAILFVSEANAQSVSGSVAAIKRGGSGRGTVVFSIPGGLHTNSNRPGSEFAIPTVVSISSPNGKISGISYPRGKSKKFGYSEDTLNIYEGTVKFGFNVSVPATFKGNSIKIRAVVKYQACTESVCYPPKSQEVTFTASVK
jgi:DsbC/DsbD-like thiol-disulfide interchange protein